MTWNERRRSAAPVLDWVDLMSQYHIQYMMYSILGRVSQSYLVAEEFWEGSNKIQLMKMMN